MISILLLTSSDLAADKLTRLAQQELNALGYEVDNTDGEATTSTVIAISQIQAENDLEIIGGASPQLVGRLRASSSPVLGIPSPASPPSKAIPAPAGVDLQARQQACLQEKYAASQVRKKKKRGFRRLLSAVCRCVGKPLRWY